MKPQIILASASPRRKELLNQLGISFLIQTVNTDETPFTNESPLIYVQRVASEKSAAAFALYGNELPILAADTSVVLNNQILGKPENEFHAQQMLQQLSGTTHQVYTAISLRYQNQTELKELTALNITEVTFRKISETEIKTYWQTGEPLDKAGGYAIQGLGSIFIETINGSFSSVMGLPLFETAQLLTQIGMVILK